MANSKIKKYLKLLTVVGLVAVVGGGAGTFASFSAQTTNKENTFETGTLVLENNVASKICLSTGGGTTNTNENSTGCEKLFAAALKEPGESAESSLTLTNKGSLAASELKLTGSKCKESEAGAYHGTGKLCEELKFYVQEWKDEAHTEAWKCWYGGTSSANTCDTTFKATPASLSGIEGTFGLNEGPSATAFAAKGSAGDTRYFTIGVGLPKEASNEFQGRKVEVDLSWKELQ